jgi:hypothetical protein
MSQETLEIPMLSEPFIVDVSRRPRWWMNVVYDYEDNVLGGRDVSYPDRATYQIQHLTHYGFVTDEMSDTATFPNPNDYIKCLLKFGTI